MTTLVVAATRAEAAHVPAGLPVILSGIGKVEAAAATARAIAETGPDLVVNIGTAGALRDGVEGLFLPSLVVNHDLSAAAIRALGHHARDEIGIDGGDGTVLATGDLFVTDPVVRDRLAQCADLVDMEGFAVARACEVAGVPVRLVKVVSDNADDTALDWPAVVDRCAQRLGDWLTAHV